MFNDKPFYLSVHSKKWNVNNAGQSNLLSGKEINHKMADNRSYCEIEFDKSRAGRTGR